LPTLKKTESVPQIKPQPVAQVVPQKKQLFAKRPDSATKKSGVVLKQSDMDALIEQNRLLKFQMRNSCKMLMKVDEFMTDLQGKKANKPVDSTQLNSVITDLRDALNMLNNLSNN
jgi:hypothetical protein